MNIPRSTLLVACSFSAFMAFGCHDDKRDEPHATHSHTKNEPVAQPVTPQKTDTQAKVSGSPTNTATPAPAGEPAGTAPSKTTESNKVSGSATDGATAAPQPAATTKPEKAPTTGKDATP